MTDIPDIEPYNDQDVPHIIERLIRDDEFIKVIGQRNSWVGIHS